MPAQPIAIKKTGLVTSVGLSAPASCAAIRAKVSNPTETRFIDSGGEWIMAHQVPLEKPWRGRTKLTKMAAMAIAECLDGIPREEWTSMPLLLCVAERERPGRLEGLDDQLFLDIQQELDARFAPGSAIVAHGRVSAAIALVQARQLIYGSKVPHVIVAAVDSLLTWPTLSVYEREGRLLTARNSNGFMPGEAGGALLLGRWGGKAELLCTGIGFGVEKAHIDSGEPLRAEGLTLAIKGALADAGCEMHDLDYRITDLSGEQYYFKEAALALSRTLRKRKEAFDIWHPAECTGEAGAAVGVAVFALADAACRKAYSLGPHILTHLANDKGQRFAVVLNFGVP
ncbi:MAG: fabB [Nevskia sp.]|jgi:3-oxoacyl-[acyl-carrier-protein] synthase-1|nr:fabB [Nevskia sp.]